MALKPTFADDWGTQEPIKKIPIINHNVNKHSELVKQLFRLYILRTDKYLSLYTNGRYTTTNYVKGKDDNIKPLLDWMVVSHLKGLTTIGTYAGKNASKFICFDIDTKELAGQFYYKLINALVNIGIPKEFIYPSFSGTKGYHVEIFFSNPISVSDLQKLYNKILADINATKEEIEFRPTYTQGVKIPLGRNFKSQDMKNNICWFIDRDTLEPIKDLEYMLKIQKIDSNIITEIIKSFSPTEKKRKSNLNNSNLKTPKEKKVISLPVFSSNEYEIENLEKLYREGINQPGTRHKAIIKLAKYFRYLGCTKEQSKIDLMEWLERQPAHSYSSTREEIEIDIEQIVEWVYENNKGITAPRNTIEFYKEEIDYILNASSKNEKILLFYMMIHNKRYSDNNGIFYMTYEQMTGISGLSDKTTRNIVNKLSENNLIEIVSRNEKQEKTYLKKPNTYRIKQIEITSTNTYNIKSDSTLSDCLFCFYSKDELKKILKRREYEYFTSNIINCNKNNSLDITSMELNNTDINMINTYYL